MPSTDPAPDPVVVPFWPTCKDALTWSADSLAVASGEFVHVLTPCNAVGADAKPNEQTWQKDTFRINQFSKSEWPPKELAPVADFSIGEELSESMAVGIAWSPPGLGLYSRSVLAVLTSNLLLSFWETDGKSGVWQRTAVVNNEVHRGSKVPGRRQRRIRAFCWISVPTEHSKSKYGPHLLAIADDNRAISVVWVSKRRGTGYGTWDFALITKYELPSQPLQLPSVLSLREILSQTSPVSKIWASDWIHEPNHSGDEETISVHLRIECGQTYMTSLRLRIAENLPAGTSSSMPVRATIDEAPSTSIEGNQLTIDLFKSTIDKVSADFDRLHQLGGSVRVRHWGTVVSADHTLAAACITLHPSDMIEHGRPSLQKTTIVFVRLAPTVSYPNATEEEKVSEKIVSYLAAQPAECIKTKMDMDIVRNAILLIRMAHPRSVRLQNWAKSAEATLIGRQDAVSDNSNGRKWNNQAKRALVDKYVGQSAQSDQLGRERLDPEKCEICDSDISFASDTTIATCDESHHFTRCQLSFLAIQEPGISKYCSKCGKQFLDFDKFRSDGPSLSQALFDEFDVCPYCQGRFRG